MCAIHAVVRAWVVASGQYTENARIDASVVEAVRNLCLKMLLTKYNKMVKPVTPYEKLCNTLGRPTKVGTTLTIEES